MSGAMRTSFLRLAATASSLAAAASLAHAQNLLTNASFENIAIATNFKALTTSSTDLTNWTIGQGTAGPNTGAFGIDMIRGFWQPHSGAQSIDLNNRRAGSISQTVALTANVNYAVDFWMSGLKTTFVGSPQRIKTLDVLLDNAVVATASFDSWGADGIQGNADDPTNANMRWQFRKFGYIRPTQSRNYTLTFMSTTTNTDLGPALDDVSLSVMIPEPATGALALVGVAPLAWVLRRRRVR